MSNSLESEVSAQLPGESQLALLALAGLTQADACPCDVLPGFPGADVIKFGASQLGPKSMSDFDSSALSPCIRNCCLGDDLTCLGCFRSLEEIKEWGVVDSHRRRIILQNARQRREAAELK